MVDLHSHILPGLDDGARTLEESLRMIELAAASGTTDIVATPHANHQFRFEPERVQAAYQVLLEESGGLINIHLGCDFHLSYDNLRDALENPDKYTVDGTQYLMVELPDVIAFPSIRLALKQLIGSRIVPVITHPERNVTLRQDLKELRRWIDDGCLLQVTAQSFLGKFGNSARQAAEWLMKANLVHFVASDAHDCLHRPPELAAGYHHVSQRYGSGPADAVFLHNPTAVLRGESVAPKTQNFFERFFFQSRHSFK